MSKPKSIDRIAEFEQAIADSKADISFYKLRLYVTGSTSRSGRAIQNIKTLCDTYLAGRYELEIVDIHQQPQLAQSEQIIAAPTLIKSLPIPPRKIIGDLSDTQRVLMGLNLPTGEGSHVQH